MSLMEVISRNSADYAVENYCQHLPAEVRAEMWIYFYNSAYCALMTFDEASSASRFRASAMAMEN